MHIIVVYALYGSGRGDSSFTSVPIGVHVFWIQVMHRPSPMQPAWLYRQVPFRGKAAVSNCYIEVLMALMVVVQYVKFTSHSYSYTT